MTDWQVDRALEQAAVEVLQQMFFVDAVRQSAPSSTAASLAVELTFDGDPPGHLLLSLEPQAAVSIAANFLGANAAALTTGQVADVACELSNMICGTALSRLESTATFRLSSPAVLSDPRPPANGAVVCLDTGEGNLIVTMCTETPICQTPAKSAF